MRHLTRFLTAAPVMPLYRFDIHARLSAAEVQARIQSLAGPVDAGSFWRVRTTLTAFEFRRDSRYSDHDNDFVPRVRGRVHERSSGCTVRVRMSLAPFVAVFMIAWLGFTGSIALSKASVGGASMFLVGLLMTLLGFYLPAWRMRARLVEALTRNG